jgi:small-conductance mechanosensitive channel
MVTLLGYSVDLPPQLAFLSAPVVEFILNLLLWLALAVVSYWVILPIIKRITRFMPGEVEDIIVGIIRRPVSLLVFVIGARVSLQYLEFADDPKLFLSRLTMTLIIVITGLLIGRLIRDVFVYYGEQWARRTESQVDDILIPVLSLFGPLLLITIAALIILPLWGVDVSSVLLGAGVLGLVLGLALQETLSNIFSGLGLLIEAPFKRGDLIRLVNGKVCEVQRLGLRSTTLLSLDEQATIFMPNKVLATDYLINLTKPTAEQRYSVSVTVDSPYDLATVKNLLYGIAAGHPAVVCSDLMRKIPYIETMVARMRERAANRQLDDPMREELLTAAQNNEVSIRRLTKEAEVNRLLGLLKDDIRVLIRGIRSREASGLSREELYDIRLLHMEPVERRIGELKKVVEEWVVTPDDWLWEGDYWALRKNWLSRNEDLDLHWSTLKKVFERPDERLEFRLDDLSGSLIDWLDNEYKIIPGPWKDPIIEVKQVSAENCDLELHYYVDNIRLEMDGRPRRIRSELNHLIREELVQEGIWAYRPVF